MVGGALLALLLPVSGVLLGYVLRLPAKLRFLAWLPVFGYTGLFTFNGYANWVEAETGYAMGIPMVVTIGLGILAIVVRLISKAPLPSLIRVQTDESTSSNRLQVFAGLLTVLLPMPYGEVERDYVRPTAAMQCATDDEDWEKVKAIAAGLGNTSARPLTAYYAIALVQTDQIASNLFDIRMEYEEVYAHGRNGEESSINLYEMECSYYAGLIETAYHRAMLNLTMEGPSIRNLKMLCRTSMLRSEWEAAEKYLTILEEVPFEESFCQQWRQYLHKEEKLNKNRTVAKICELEPIEDDFENNYIRPTFLGYYKELAGARSRNSLYCSLMLNLYTKDMAGFMVRLHPLVGQGKLPQTLSEAITLMSQQEPSLGKAFPLAPGTLKRQKEFFTLVQPLTRSLEMREQHAAEFFEKYKGYYPYYYVFGNLKATIRSDQHQGSSASGVN